MTTDSDRPVEATPPTPAAPTVHTGTPAVRQSASAAGSPANGRWTYLRRQWLIPLLPIVLALVVATLVVWLAS